ncbi:MAG: nucleotidyl transferase AbiEii/AbiGii toxin family protein [Gordonibacter sp.]|uniref:nucleotidyl transferase AbiEii/AbiGii toxin family protein n=1 Tax=Gordonibacter sp. TaxID=1968902 RepID=UPI002FC8EB3F
MYLHESADDWLELVRRTSQRYSFEQSFVAKDYFIFLALKLIAAKDPELIFKGGTCLSKCHNAISRFSEDVDLGIEAEKATEGRRKKMKATVTSVVEDMGLTVSNLNDTRSRREYNKYLVPLPAIGMGLGSDTLIIETAVMTPASPAVSKMVDTFVFRLCLEDGFDDVVSQYGLEPFEIKTNSIERTFADKVFAVCDYYLSEVIPARQSRHIYDLYKLLPTLTLDANLADLFSTVKRQRKGVHHCFSAEDQVDIPATLDSIRTDDAYRKDYETITLPLLYEDIPYEKAVAALKPIAAFLREYKI